MEFIKFMGSAAINFVVAFIIVRFIYYPAKQSKAYVFTFLAFNTIIFFVLRFASQIELSVGIGFGLFAIFSILRYRTNPIPIREMTYLLVITALPMLNSLLFTDGFSNELMAANVLVIVILAVLEKGWGFHYLSRKDIVYENMELVRPDRYSELLEDLKQRTGLNIRRCEIGKINLLNDTAALKIYFEDPCGFAASEVETDMDDDD